MTNELTEAIDAALAISRNFATAKPDIGRTEREHILGLANLLERAQTALRSAAPEGYRLVPAERLQSALDQVQGAMKEAYNSAYPECCGRPGLECCGSPEPAWRDEDQRIMDVLHPVQQELTAMLAAAPDHSEQVRQMVPEAAK